MWFSKKDRQTLERIAMDISILKEAWSGFATNFGTFATDFQKFTGDFAKFMTTVQTTNPNDQVEVDNIVAGLRGFGNQVAGFDASIKDIDAKINPPAAQAQG